MVLCAGRVRSKLTVHLTPSEPLRSTEGEGAVGEYVKGSFVPLREFRSLADANQQLRAWVLGEAGNRIHGTTHERPLTRFIGVERHMYPAFKESADVLTNCQSLDEANVELLGLLTTLRLPLPVVLFLRN